MKFNYSNQVIQTTILESTLYTNGGDSGGPVVNDRGELVAVHSGNFTNANGRSIGIDVSQLKALLAGDYSNTAKTPFAVISFQNRTQRTLNFECRWSRESNWRSVKMPAGHTRYFWLNQSSQSSSLPTFQVRFDSDSSDRLSWKQKEFTAKRAMAVGKPVFYQGLVCNFFELDATHSIVLLQLW